MWPQSQLREIVRREANCTLNKRNYDTGIRVSWSHFHSSQLIDISRCIIQLKIINKQAGFSFIEVLISLAIIALIGTGLLLALGTATKGSLQTDTRTEAENLAISVMESIKSANYVYAPSGGFAGYSFAAPPVNYQICTLDRSGLPPMTVPLIKS